MKYELYVSLAVAFNTLTATCTTGGQAKNSVLRFHMVELFGIF